MSTILRHLARAFLLAQLKDPTTATRLHAFLNAQMEHLLTAETAKVGPDSNAVLKVLAAALTDPTLKAELYTVVDDEADQLLSLLIARI